MYVVRSNQGQTVVRFSDTPISNHRPMSEFRDYIKSLADHAYSVEQEYGYNALTDEYYVRYTVDEYPGKVYYRASRSELEIVHKVTEISIFENLHLLDPDDNDTPEF